MTRPLASDPAARFHERASERRENSIPLAAIIACSIVVVLIAVFVLQNTRSGTIHVEEARAARCSPGIH
jgi:uncharacterized integral membrane protein